MRLIDADAMLKRNENSIYDTTDLKEMLGNEPTAFNVDKVVEEMKKCQKHHEDNAAEYDMCGEVTKMDLHDAIANAYSNAIKIVKRGGVRMEAEKNI